MKFTKMQGAGNDYIYVDCFQTPIPTNLSELARRMSDRHFGIGGDGLILICPPDDVQAKAAAKMRMFNADGSEAEMCGNGLRCVAKYVYDHGICRQEQFSIDTGAGVLQVQVELNPDRIGAEVQRVRVNMGEPILGARQIPTELPGQKRDGSVVNAQLNIGGQVYQATCVSMGNPHCVLFVEQATDDLVLGRGPQIETHQAFPARTNVEFVEVISPTELRQRTWERGSGETLACGTGASAVCVAGVLSGRSERNVLIHLRGGDLELHWSEDDNHVYMTGPVVEVFTGDWPTD